MNKVFLVSLVVTIFFLAAPFSSAFEMVSIQKKIEIKEVKETESREQQSSKSNPPLEENYEIQKDETGIKSSQNSSPSPSGADVKGVEVTPKLSIKPVIIPAVKPDISPSPLPSPSASIDPSPSAQPILESVEQKHTPVILKIWNLIFKFFNR